MKKEIIRTIEKLARGYSVEEITEEYGVEDGQLKLVKRREVTKEVPPDLKAVKMLEEGEDYAAMTDEELERERKRLLRQFQEECNES